MSRWGIEAEHVWNGGAWTLNEKVTWPRTKLARIDGLSSLSDFEPPADSAINQRGEVARSGSRGGRTIVYSGTLQAQTAEDLRDAEDAMLGAFDPTVEKEMVITPDPAYASGGRKYLARAAALNLVDEQVASPHRVSRGFERDFVLTLRLSDPRIYDIALQTDTSGAGSAQLTNGILNPRAGALSTAGWTNVGMDFYGPVALPAVEGLPSGISTGFIIGGANANDRIWTPFAVVNGTQYTVSAYVMPTQSSGSAIGLQVRRADGTTIVGEQTTSTIGPFVRLSVTFTAAATENYQLNIRQVAAGAIGAYVTAFQAQAAAAASNYFDGDMPGAFWTGGSHVSTSTLRARRDAAVVHNGTIDTPPTIKIGPSASDIVGPVLRHRELDRYLSFAAKTLTNGQFLVVNFKDRTVKLNGVVPAQDYLDRANSDWWDEGVPGLIPGAQTVELYRSTAGEAEVQFYDAFTS